MIVVLRAAQIAVFTVHYLIRYFRRGNLKPFGSYCLLFGGGDDHLQTPDACTPVRRRPSRSRAD